MTNYALSPSGERTRPRVLIAAPRRNVGRESSRWRGRHRQHARRVRSPDSLATPRSCETHTHTHSCVTDVARGYRGIPELTIFLETARLARLKPRSGRED